ncbi:hypothetical protein KIL84_007858 [Mauremys mutica]|uniref:Uncharacterized protein n=1 Tax=Mauremys mutica TaxID=74926 RepID=A0A9D3X3X0_9SAUR|nr:hypothetical protein KIL84_007858 [Mauremys mutica]
MGLYDTAFRDLMLGRWLGDEVIEIAVNMEGDWIDSSVKKTKTNETGEDSMEDYCLYCNDVICKKENKNCMVVKNTKWYEKHTPYLGADK